MAFSKFFNSVEPLFKKNGKYEKLYPIFEMVETIFYTRNTVTKAAPHARSFVDMKRNSEELKFKQDSFSPYVWGESIKIKGDKNV